jgi:hypothetical protein
MTLHVEAAREWVRLRNIDVTERILVQLHTFDRTRSPRAHRRDLNVGLLLEKAHKLSKLCWEVIVYEQHIHLDSILLNFAIVLVERG